LHVEELEKKSLFYFSEIQRNILNKKISKTEIQKQQQQQQQQ